MSYYYIPQASSEIFAKNTFPVKKTTIIHSELIVSDKQPLDVSKLRSGAYKVKELKSFCEFYGVNSNGKKEILIGRLLMEINEGKP